MIDNEARWAEQLFGEGDLGVCVVPNDCWISVPVYRGRWALRWRSVAKAIVPLC
ncbi:hypothetical protein FHR87_002930 [Azomonas macrocytogenes]|uniref:Uncharacterized protein n=1 Tax=Azomonas macrocytogenes TaxID=69962 RepID=A0A839T6N9_AZOMA|nr:hypothetical protein [Azomonas macrocytogenes]